MNLDEKEANYFAMLLLLPERLVRDYVKRNKVVMDDDRTVKQMAKHFQVPEAILSARLQQLFGEP